MNSISMPLHEVYSSHDEYLVPEKEHTAWPDWKKEYMEDTGDILRFHGFSYVAPIGQENTDGKCMKRVQGPLRMTISHERTQGAFTSVTVEWNYLDSRYINTRVPLSKELWEGIRARKNNFVLLMNFGETDA